MPTVTDPPRAVALALRLAVLACALLTAAHWLRWSAPGQAAAAATLGLTAAVAPQLVPRPLAALLLSLAAAFWTALGLELVGLRLETHLPWARLALLLGAVAAAHVGVAAAVLRAPGAAFGPLDGVAWARTAGFGLSFGLIHLAEGATSTILLLGERLLPGSGPWWEVVFALYAAWLVGALLGQRGPLVRVRVWLLFSFVFFGQLVLGLAGWTVFLMTGALHLPVPALILASPLYRGQGVFMLALFGASLLLVGPAWCSHLCYVGAWDALLARLGPRCPRALPRWAPAARAGILALALAVPLLLRLLEVPALPALTLAGCFGLGGVAVMGLASRRLGTMAHCTLWCPLGLAANLLGRLSPWRLRMTAACTGCGRCARACRYGAMSAAAIARRRPGRSCTLCGDCLGACPHDALEYRLANVEGRWPRLLFVTLAASLHAVFLAVARI